MARPQSPAEWLRTSRSSSERIASLQLLKNEITGHIEKKERYVEKGVLDQVVRLLQTSRSAQNHNDKNRREGLAQVRSLSEQEDIRLQALQVLTVIANGRSIGTFLSSRNNFELMRFLCRGAALSTAHSHHRRHPSYSRQHIPPRQPSEDSAMGTPCIAQYRRILESSEPCGVEPGNIGGPALFAPLPRRIPFHPGVGEQASCGCRAEALGGVTDNPPVPCREPSK